MTAPSPSPTPGTVPHVPAPLPAPPDYHGAAAAGQQAAAGTTSSNPADWWGLGDAYGQTIFVGTATTPVPIIDPTSGTPRVGGPTTETPQGVTTQDFMKSVLKMWASQNEERLKNPGGLTGYEQLQQELWSAGFYGQTSYDSVHVGQWTPQTQAAIVGAIQAYETAKRSTKLPMTFADFLSTNSAQGSTGGFNVNSGSSSGSTGPTQVNLTDPAAIRAAAQTAAQQALGRGLSEKQLEQFVNQFQQTQQQVATSTAATVSAPSLSDQAMQFVQENDPHAYAANKRQSYVNALIDMFAPSGSQRPGTTPVPSV